MPRRSTTSAARKFLLTTLVAVCAQAVPGGGGELLAQTEGDYLYRVTMLRAAQAEYPEVMTGQGSCWFTTREWNDYIGLLDEGVGSWGNVGIEVSLRTWLCGGTQIVNKKAWQAHWFRKDEGGFPYPMDGRC